MTSPAACLLSDVIVCVCVCAADSTRLLLSEASSVCLQSCVDILQHGSTPQCNTAAEFRSRAVRRAVEELKGTAITPAIMSGIYSRELQPNTSVAAVMSSGHLACAAWLHACFSVAAIWSCHRPVGLPTRSLGRHQWMQSLAVAWSGQENPAVCLSRPPAAPAARSRPQRRPRVMEPSGSSPVVPTLTLTPRSAAPTAEAVVSPPAEHEASAVGGPYERLMLERCLWPRADLRAIWREYESWEAVQSDPVRALWLEYEAWEATQRDPLKDLWREYEAWEEAQAESHAESVAVA